MRVALALLCAACGLAGCERLMRDMYDQPRPGPDAGSGLFADGKASRPPPPGSLAIASGDLASTSGGLHGREDLRARAAAEAASAPPPASPTLLARGHSRHDIACAPCHSPLGDGDGMIVRRGFPRPPDYGEARLRDAPDRHLYDVISAGYGAMPSYADRLAPEDRWAVVAYVRQLQRARPVIASASATVPEPAR